MKKDKKDTKFLLTFLILLLFVISIYSISFGDAKIGFFKSYEIVVNRIKDLLLGNEISRTPSEMIIMNIRVPRILAAIFIGMGLSSVGCTYQGIFKNPMADPYILGISSGATLGAALMIVFNKTQSYLGFGLVTLAAFLGALVTTVLVYMLAMKNRKVSTIALLLSGIATSYLISAFVSMILVFNEKNVSKIIYWTMGSLVGLSYRQLAILIPSVLLGSLVLLYFSRELDIISSSEEVAETLGVNVQRVRKTLLLVSSFIVAVCVSFTGIIGFVGLMIPHITRIVTGPNHRRLIPVSMVSGSIFLVISDTIARSLIDSAELPIGAVTALFGAPYFMYLLMKRKRNV